MDGFRGAFCFSEIPGYPKNLIDPSLPEPYKVSKPGSSWNKRVIHNSTYYRGEV